MHSEYNVCYTVHCPTDKALKKYSMANTKMPDTGASQAVSENGSDPAGHTQQLAPLSNHKGSNTNNNLHREWEHFYKTHSDNSVVPTAGNDFCHLGFLSCIHMTEILSRNLKSQHNRMTQHNLQLLKCRRIKKLIHTRCKISFM